MNAAVEIVRSQLPNLPPRGPVKGVYVLLPVWGQRYLRQCLDVCIPSILAPGNFPAVAAMVPTIFVLMTRTRDMPSIRAHPAWLALAAVCEVRLESIDDLLSRAASVVLTLAYTRAIRTLGAAACEIGFVFLVADYVVADGALRYIVGRLQCGVDAMLAGNFQIVQEATGPLLAAARAPDGVSLCVQPRALVRFSLDWLHPTTNACMAGDVTTHDARANRVFWRVGSDTLLGHFYLMHMVAIRPQTVDVVIAGPCDYTFVPEFCPNGRIETITDSDAYLVAEMQPASAAPEDSRPGPLNPARLARSLAEWVTARHRMNAAYPVVYRSAAAERSLPDAIEAAARFIAETNRLLGSTVFPHRHHPYWAGALDHHQATAPHPMDWTEIVTILGPGSVQGAPGRLRQLLLGRTPRPRPWHPHWTDLRVVRARAAMLAAGNSLLIVSAEPGRTRAHLISAARAAGARDVAHMEPDEALAMAAPCGQSRASGTLACFDAALIIIDPADGDSLRELPGAVARLVMDNAHVVLALSDLSDASTRPIAPADVALAAEQMGSGLRTERLEMVPAPRWRIVWQNAMMMRTKAALRARDRSARLRLLPIGHRAFGHLAVGIACAGLSLLANLACLRGVARGRRGPCSTALVHLVRGRQSPAADSAPRARQLADSWTA